MAAKGRSFAADMRARDTPKRKPRSPFVEYDQAGNVRNPEVGPESPFAVMQKGNPVPRHPENAVLDFARAAGQTLQDTYHLGQTPLPWQTAAPQPPAPPPPPPVAPVPQPVTPNVPPSMKKKAKGKR